GLRAHLRFLRGLRPHLLELALLTQVGLPLLLGLSCRVLARLFLLARLVLAAQLLLAACLAIGLLLTLALGFLLRLQRDVGLRIGLRNSGLGRLRYGLRRWWRRLRNGLWLHHGTRRLHDGRRRGVELGGNGFRRPIAPRHGEHQHPDEEKVHADREDQRGPLAARRPRGRGTIAGGHDGCHLSGAGPPRATDAPRSGV